MRINTYTNVWSTKKQIYSIWDWSLPKPISLVAVGLFVGTLVVWAPLLAVLGVPFASPTGLLFYLLVPGGVAFVGDKPMFEGKSIVQFAGSMAGYVFQPRIWTALRPEKDFRKDSYHISGKAWVPMDGGEKK